MEIRYEKPGDIPAIRRVNQAAFETRVEADLVDVLRDKKAHIISMVAEKEDRIIGHILFSPVTLATEGSEVTLLGLAPMAVLPGYQKQGVGSKLVDNGLAEGRRKGYPAVVVLGHPDYYPRFGFIPSQKYSITSEYDVPPEVFMIIELQPGVLAGKSGIAKYHEAFAELQRVYYFDRNQLQDAPCAVLGPEDSARYVELAGGRAVAPEEPFEVLFIGDETGYPFLETVDTVLSGVFQKFDSEEKFHNHEK